MTQRDLVRRLAAAGDDSLIGGVARIAVLRANALGDLVFALPALAALRAAYPAAEMVLLARPWHAEFAPARVPGVDRTVVVPRHEGIWAEPGGVDDQEELAAFFARMREERFDLVLQLHGGGRHSNPFVRRLGARVTAGLATPDADPLDRTVPYVYYQPEVFRLLEVVARVGAPAVGNEPRLPVLEADVAEAGRLVDLTQPLAALHPGATDGRRRWPPERFAAVGDALAGAGAAVLVTGTQEEAGLVDEVVRRMEADATGLAGAVSTGGLAGLLSCCGVVVSNDSGPLHLAAAVGAATVGIFWCGNLINAGPVTRARHRPAISWRLDCPACGTNCITGSCRHSASFVADVTVEEVVGSALDLWADATTARLAERFPERRTG
ncbi:MAG: glycosyltransferase family 9 protein [Actinomycetota bacterium]|nr:glycosyltransferase family 9 protein [Actinomycetota bacterium]